MLNGAATTFLSNDIQLVADHGHVLLGRQDRSEDCKRQEIVVFEWCPECMTPKDLKAFRDSLVEFKCTEL